MLSKCTSYRRKFIIIGVRIIIHKLALAFYVLLQICYKYALMYLWLFEFGLLRNMIFLLLHLLYTSHQFIVQSILRYIAWYFRTLSQFLYKNVCNNHLDIETRSSWTQDGGKQSHTKFQDEIFVEERALTYIAYHKSNSFEVDLVSY